MKKIIEGRIDCNPWDNEYNMWANGKLIDLISLIREFDNKEVKLTIETLVEEAK